MKLNQTNPSVIGDCKAFFKINFSSTKLIFLIVASIFISLQSCNKRVEKDKDEDKPISDLSIYNLPSQWTNQDGKNLEMKDLIGKVLGMVMIYTSCKAACPRLVADMRNIEQRIPAKKKDNVKFVLVSIDPEVDTRK